jgi:splicing factor 3B subunit 4
MSDTTGTGDSTSAASVYVGGLDESVDESLLWELFAQWAGVVAVRVPKDRVSGRGQGFAFIQLATAADAAYVQRLSDGLVLCGQRLRVSAVKGKR